MMPNKEMLDPTLRNPALGSLTKQSLSSYNGNIANPLTNPMMMNPYLMGYGMQ